MPNSYSSRLSTIGDNRLFVRAIAEYGNFEQRDSETMHADRKNIIEGEFGGGVGWNSGQAPGGFWNGSFTIKKAFPANIKRLTLL